MDKTIYSVFLVVVIVGACVIKLVYLNCKERKAQQQRNRNNNNSSNINSNRNSVSRSIIQESTPVARANISNNCVYYFANGRGSLEDRTFCFSYEKVGESWRAYIVKMPSLRSRDSSFALTHRLRADDGRTYVCWDSPIHNLKDMQNVSKMWADCICEYIKTGKRFG